jgi:hypothetical protein
MSEDGEELALPEPRESSRVSAYRRNKSSSISSDGFVTAVKTVAMSVATSIAPGSHRAKRSSHLRHESTHSSCRDGSVSSIVRGIRVMDEASRIRAIKRRQILEELVSTEEGYISDLKILGNVYLGMLTHTVPGGFSPISPAGVDNARKTLDHINEMIRIHSDLLLKLREVLGYPVKSVQPAKNNAVKASFSRRHSVDFALPPVSYKAPLTALRSSLESSSSETGKETILISEPKEVAEISLIVEDFVAQLFVYEEYSASYEIVMKDLLERTHGYTNWEAYERGIENLAQTTTSALAGFEQKKGLTFADLLIKPIQRVCRYPLLFQDLVKHTPVIDCPVSHAEVEKIYLRLRETAARINNANGDKELLQKVQRSWHLQDLLLFEDPSSAPFGLRALGHAVLCGVLHVAYQTKQGVYGSYMLCALFNSCLVFGISCENGKRFNIVATINLSDVSIEAADNGKGQ